MTPASLVGLYFVTDECGPTAGRVMGKLGDDCFSVLIESDTEPRQLFVSVARLLDWVLVESQRDAARILGECIEEATSRE